jgi:hypothetical protein
VNLRAVWSDKNDRYNIIAFANNVSNALGYDGAAGTLLSGEKVGRTPNILLTPALTAPLEYGLQFQYRFK